MSRVKAPRNRSLPLKKDKLYNVQQWYRNSINKTNRLVATIAWGKPYLIARSIARMETNNRTKNYPKGTYFKLVEQ